MRIDQRTLPRLRAIAACTVPFCANDIAEACGQGLGTVSHSIEKWCKRYGYLIVVRPYSGQGRTGTPNYYAKTATFAPMLAALEAKLAGPVQPPAPKLSVVEQNYRAFREPIDTRTPEWFSYREGDSHQMKEAA